MGYYTKFDLEISGAGERWVEGVDVNGNKVTVNIGFDHDEIQAEIEEMSGYKYLFEDTVKWYDHEVHMRAISKKYPDLLFILDGIGEEAGDLWRKYFKNGLCQSERAHIEFGAFDPAKLK